MGQGDRQREAERTAKQQTQEQDQDDYNMSNVVDVPEKKNRKEPLKSLAGLAGMGFEGFNTIPDSDPIEELDESENAEHETDPALDELLEQMQLANDSGDGDDPDEDHEDQNDGDQPVHPVATEGEGEGAMQEQTEREKLLQAAEAMVANVGKEEMTYEDQIAHAKEDADRVRNLREQQADLRKRDRVPAAERLQEAIDTIFSANPEAEAILDNEEKRRQDDAKKAAQLVSTKALEEQKQELDAAVLRMNGKEGVSPSLHEAISRAQEIKEPQIAPTVFIAKGTMFPSTPPNRDGGFDRDPLPATAAAQFEIILGKGRDGDPALHYRLVDGHNLPECIYKHEGWRNAGPGIFPFSFNIAKGVMFRPRETVKTYRGGVMHRASFAIDMAAFSLYENEEKDLRREEGRERAAERLLDAVSKADTDPMAFVLEGAAGQTDFSGTFPIEKEQKYLQAVLKRYSPEELARKRQVVADTLRGWLEGKSHHPSEGAREQEEKALALISEGQRTSLEARAKAWEDMGDDYDVELAAYGLDSNPNLSSLSPKRRTVAVIEREGQSNWMLTLHHPVLMKVENRNLTVNAEKPEGQGNAYCEVAKHCKLYQEHEEMVGQAQNLGRLLRAVVLAEMREASAPADDDAEVDAGMTDDPEKSHRHSWKGGDTCITCGTNRSTGVASG